MSASSSVDVVGKRRPVTSHPGAFIVMDESQKNIRLLPRYRRKRRRRNCRHDNEKSLTSNGLHQLYMQELQPLMQDGVTSTSHTDADTDNFADVDAENWIYLTAADALARKHNSRLADHQYKPDMTSMSRDYEKPPPRFWSPLLERRQHDTVRLTAASSMFDFRFAESLDFRFKSQQSLSSTAADGKAVTSRKESIAARYCTRQRCGYCFRQFVAFLFSTVGSCCLMVGYVILGGLIFQHVEGDHGRAVDVDMERVRQRHVSWLWNLTAQMNVLHPHNWTTVALCVLDSYTAEVILATKNYGWNGKDKLEDQWTFPGALLFSITIITTIGPTIWNNLP